MWNSGSVCSPAMPAVTSSSVENVIRMISAKPRVKIARYGPLMRRHTHPTSPPSRQHMAIPAAMPSGMGMPYHSTRRAEV